MHPASRIAYCLPWIGAGAIFIWLCLIRIPPSGIREISVPLDGRSPWVNAFLPGQRATTIGPQADGWIGQRISDEPVYATLRLPGVYNQLRYRLEFRTDDQPLLEIGAAHEPAKDVAFEPLWSEVLASGWHPARWQGKVGYVRDGLPDDRLGQANMNKLLTWHATSTVPDYMDTSPQPHSFTTALRGSYDLQAVPVQGAVSFTIQLQDMNRARQKGSVIITLSKNGILLSSDAVSLSGSRDNRPSEVVTKNISYDHLAAGVYKLSIVADDDIFTRSISSPLRHWVIGPRLYFGDQVGYATTTLPGIAWTNAQHVQLLTVHKEGLQTVSLGDATVQVQSTHETYSLDRLPTQQTSTQLIRAPRGDIRLIGDGYFALAPDLLFLPAPRRLTDASHPIEEGIEAILTSYRAPQALGDGWYLSSTVYHLDARPGTVRLTLGAPGIKDRSGSVDVRAVHLRYERAGLSLQDWARAVWRELASAWHSL